MTKQRSVLRAMLFLILIILLLACFLINLSMGSSPIAWQRALKIVISGPAVSNVENSVIWQIRLPRLLAALFSGAALAVAGLLLQIYFGNPLVDSFVLGTASGASLLVGLALMAGTAWGFRNSGPFSLAFWAFFGALLVMLLVLAVSRRIRHNVTLLVVGLMVGYLCNAITSLLIAFAEKEALQGFVFWSLGSFSGFTWPQLKALILITSLALLGAGFLVKPLNALILGEDYAQSLGIKVKRLRILVVVVASVLGGTVSAFAGPVAFLGLAVPHLSRLTFGTSDNRILLPATLLMGALLSGGCDLMARLVLNPVELPLSAVTSFFGAPLVIGMLLRRNKLHELS